MNKNDIDKIGYVPYDSYINADCFDIMKYIDDNSIDMILCDLPYG